MDRYCGNVGMKALARAEEGRVKARGAQRQIPGSLSQAWLEVDRWAGRGSKDSSTRERDDGKTFPL